MVLTFHFCTGEDKSFFGDVGRSEDALLQIDRTLQPDAPLPRRVFAPWAALALRLFPGKLVQALAVQPFGQFVRNGFVIEIGKGDVCVAAQTRIGEQQDLNLLRDD